MVFQEKIADGNEVDAGDITCTKYSSSLGVCALLFYYFSIAYSIHLHQRPPYGCERWKWQLEEATVRISFFFFF